MRRLSIDRKDIKVKKLGNIFRPYVVVGVLVIVLTFGIWIYIGAQSLDISEPFNRDAELMRLYIQVTREKERSFTATSAERTTRYVELTRLQIELLNSMDPR